MSRLEIKTHHFLDGKLVIHTLHDLPDRFINLARTAETIHKLSAWLPLLGENVYVSFHQENFCQEVLDLLFKYAVDMTGFEFLANALVKQFEWCVELDLTSLSPNVMIHVIRDRSTTPPPHNENGLILHPPQSTGFYQALFQRCGLEDIDLKANRKSFKITYDMQEEHRSLFIKSIDQVALGINNLFKEDGNTVSIRRNKSNDEQVTKYTKRLDKRFQTEQFRHLLICSLDAPKYKQLSKFELTDKLNPSIKVKEGTHLTIGFN